MASWGAQDSQKKNVVGKWEETTWRKGCFWLNWNQYTQYGQLSDIFLSLDDMALNCGDHE